MGVQGGGDGHVQWQGRRPAQVEVWKDTQTHPYWCLVVVVVVVAVVVVVFFFVMYSFLLVFFSVFSHFCAFTNEFICDVSTDIAEVSVEQSKERYTHLVQKEAGNKRPRQGQANRRGLFSAEFITADCTKVLLHVVPSCACNATFHKDALIIIIVLLSVFSLLS